MVIFKIRSIITNFEKRRKKCKHWTCNQVNGFISEKNLLQGQYLLRLFLEINRFPIILFLFAGFKIRIQKPRNIRNNNRQKISTVDFLQSASNTIEGNFFNWWSSCFEISTRKKCPTYLEFLESTFNSIKDNDFRWSSS